MSSGELPPGWRRNEATEGSRVHRPDPAEKEATTRAEGNSRSLLEMASNLLGRLQELQRMEAKLAQAAARRQKPGRRVVRQIERERQRLGRELHTGVGQLLSAIRLQAEIIQKLLPNPPADVDAALQRVTTLATSALNEVRGISKQLYAPEWQALTIEDAIRQLWETSGVAQSFTSSLDITALPHEPDPDVKTLLYRATQEALSNITRHAQASRVDLTLGVKEGQLRLTIRDNGKGFDPAAIMAGRSRRDAGIGLRALREQAADLQGKLMVQSGPQGTTLDVFAPLHLYDNGTK